MVYENGTSILFVISTCNVTEFLMLSRAINEYVILMFYVHDTGLLLANFSLLAATLTCDQDEYRAYCGILGSTQFN